MELQRRGYSNSHRQSVESTHSNHFLLWHLEREYSCLDVILWEAVACMPVSSRISSPKEQYTATVSKTSRCI